MTATRVGAVVLTMGDRPRELRAALESLLSQRGVDLDVVVVGNGWEPVGLPPGVRGVHLPENVGIPAGRNAGAAEVRGEVLFFYDDDARLPRDDVLARLVRELHRPGVAAVQPRPVDPTGRPGPARWVPRVGGRGALRAGPVAWVWEGSFVVRRDAFTGAGGWPGRFFYGHEGIELLWRIWDQGYVGWYAPDVVVDHPAESPTRHEQYHRLNARNRVWVARRNLPWPLVPGYLAVWTAITLVRVRDAAALRTWVGGFREGWTEDPGPRRPIRWATVWRLTRAGRPPVV